MWTAALQRRTPKWGCLLASAASAEFASAAIINDHPSSAVLCFWQDLVFRVFTGRDRPGNLNYLLSGLMAGMREEA